jgi:hypothetical protein
MSGITPTSQSMCVAEYVIGITPRKVTYKHSFSFMVSSGSVVKLTLKNTKNTMPSAEVMSTPSHNWVQKKSSNAIVLTKVAETDSIITIIWNGA